MPQLLRKPERNNTTYIKIKRSGDTEWRERREMGLMNSVNGQLPRAQGTNERGEGALAFFSFFLSFIRLSRSFVPNANDASFEDQSISGLPNGRGISILLLSRSS